MKINKNSSIEHFVKEVKSGKEILCYGAGQVAYAIDDMLDDLDVLGRVKCFIDADKNKAGKSINLCGKNYVINNIDWLLKQSTSENVLLLTVEKNNEIINSLSVYPHLNDISCYLFTDINYSYAISKAQSNCIINTINQSLIPKVIHYCWLGGEELPAQFRANIDSWRKFNPDYEIVRHDENDYDVNKNKYMRQSYQAKKYAFVADYIRLDVIYEQGGIYMDIDVKALKRFDGLLLNKAFTSYGIWPQTTSAMFGSIAKLEIIKELRDRERIFLNEDGSYNLTTSNFYETEVLLNYGFRKDFSFQIIKNLAILTPQILATKSEWARNSDVTDLTYALHKPAGTWR